MKRAVERHAVVQPEDKSIRIVPLTQGQVAIVDAEDYERISHNNWHAAKPNKTRPFYAQRGGRKNGKPYGVWMHREIIGAISGDGKWVDHINGNTLDNRKSNLRFVTPSQSNMNKSVKSNSKTGIKGVRWRDDCQKWEARITLQQKEISLGMYASPKDAHAAYCEAAKSLFGEFARVR